MKSLRVAIVAWEVGRVASGYGTKSGGMPVIVEELPPELIKAADRRQITLEIETLSPCFGHFDRSKLTRLPTTFPVMLNGREFLFEAYEKVFRETLPLSSGRQEVQFRMVHFWDDWQLNWTSARAIYPDDPWMGLHLYSSVAQAMAGYLATRQVDTIHLHDYHVGLVPFYFPADFLARVPIHFTIHNGLYQGRIPLRDGGFEELRRINLSGETLFHKYFDHFDHLNLMKACMLRIHELGGRITTVSGDLEATWGYAAELRESRESLWQRAWAEKGSPPREIFLPNGGLDLFEKLPIAGITNGLGDSNRPENLPFLKAAFLQDQQAQRPARPLFRHPAVQAAMLAKDHTFDVRTLAVKSDLQRLLHLEAFDREPVGFPVILAVVGRLAAQKNLGLAAEIAPHVLGSVPETKLVVLASASDGDVEGKATENAFRALVGRFPGRVYFNSEFDVPLSKLILAGSSFTLIPSRFEPCGLVDYEASLLGTVVIGRLTGGLAKVRDCAYLYSWLDVGDRAGEARAFTDRIMEAVHNYRYRPEIHGAIMRRAMAVGADWQESANQYLDLYLYGILAKNWQERKRNLTLQFVSELAHDRELFAKFFRPGLPPYDDTFDRQLWEQICRPVGPLDAAK